MSVITFEANNFTYGNSSLLRHVLQAEYIIFKKISTVFIWVFIGSPDTLLS